ncbi:MAG: AcrR family transcriptional regulator [Candidatus Promineifilaceae bacterium]|jgi:AcrR family transcriptional regulator
MARDLTKEKVVYKAVELANELGDVYQLKLKDLAAALNIKVPSLYNHLKGTDGLIYALRVHALMMLDGILRDAMAGKIGREALLAAAQSYRSFAHANPGIYQLIIPAGDADTEIERIGRNTISLLLLILGSFGLEGDEALHVVRGFRSLLHGFVSIELAGGFRLDLDLDQSFHRLFNAYIDGLNIS